MGKERIETAYQISVFTQLCEKMKKIPLGYLVFMDLEQKRMMERTERLYFKCYMYFN